MRFSPVVTEEIQNLGACRRWRRSSYAHDTSTTTTTPSTNPIPLPRPPDQEDKPSPSTLSSLHLTKPAFGSFTCPPSRPTSPTSSPPVSSSPVSPPYMFLGQTIVQQQCTNGDDANAKDENKNSTEDTYITELTKDGVSTTIRCSQYPFNENVVTTIDVNKNNTYGNDDGGHQSEEEDDNEQFFDVEEHDDYHLYENLREANIKSVSNSIHDQKNRQVERKPLLPPPPPPLPPPPLLPLSPPTPTHPRTTTANDSIEAGNIPYIDVRPEEHLVLPPPPTIRYPRYLLSHRRALFRRTIPVLIAILVATTLLILLTSTMFSELERIDAELHFHYRSTVAENEGQRMSFHHARRLAALLDERGISSSSEHSRIFGNRSIMELLHDAFSFHTFPFLETFSSPFLKTFSSPLGNTPSNMRSRFVSFGNMVKIGLPQTSAAKIRYGISDVESPFAKGVLIRIPQSTVTTINTAKPSNSNASKIKTTQKPTAKPPPETKRPVPVLAANIIHINPDGSAKPATNKPALPPVVLDKKKKEPAKKGSQSKPPSKAPPIIPQGVKTVDLKPQPKLPPFLGNLPHAGPFVPGLIGPGLPFNIHTPVMKKLETIEVWHLPKGKFLCQIPNAAKAENGQIIVPKWMETHKEFLSERCGLANCIYGINFKGLKVEIVPGTEKEFRNPLKLDMKYSDFDLFGNDAPRQHMPHYVSDIIKSLIATEVLLGSGRTILVPFTLNHIGQISKLRPSIRRFFLFKPALLMLPETWNRPNTDWVKRFAGFFRNPALGFTMIKLDDRPGKENDGKPLTVRIFNSIITSNVNPYEPYGLFGTTGKNIVFAANGISREPPWTLPSVKQKPCRISITALTRMGPRALLELDVLEKSIKQRAKSENIRPDFQVVDFSNMSFDQQVRTMQQTQILIATHGAGNANIIFMRPGAAFVEVFPFSYKAGPFDGFAKIFGLEYSTVMSAPQTEVFKTCMEQNEKNEYIRKLVLQKWDDAVKEEKRSPWVHRLELEKEFGEPGKSQGMITRGCVRLQQLKFNIDAVTEIVFKSGRSQCYLGSVIKT